MTSDPAEPSDLARTLALLDGLVAPVLTWVAPLRFDLARTPAEREAVYRLRYQVVIERGWGSPAWWPDGLERDADDADAVHVVGWDGSRPVATNRLVFPRPGRRLPTEAAFDLVVAPVGQVVDWNRTIVARGAGGGAHRAVAGLLARSWQATRAEGYHAVCGDFAPAVVRLYRLIGVHVEPLGPPQPYWGEERAPIRLDLLRSAPALAAWFARVSAGPRPAPAP
jgi:N-acyl-L-homoserine lactone synthetase